MIIEVISEQTKCTEQKAYAGDYEYRLVVDEFGCWDLTRREMLYVEGGDCESGPRMYREAGPAIEVCAEGMSPPDMRSEIERFLAECEQPL